MARQAPGSHARGPRSSIPVSTTAGVEKPGAPRPARYASIVDFCTSRNACMVCWNDSMARSVELGDCEVGFMALSKSGLLFRSETARGIAGPIPTARSRRRAAGSLTVGFVLDGVPLAMVLVASEPLGEAEPSRFRRAHRAGECLSQPGGLGLGERACPAAVDQPG